MPPQVGCAEETSRKSSHCRGTNSLVRVRGLVVGLVGVRVGEAEVVEEQLGEVGREAV